MNEMFLLDVVTGEKLLNIDVVVFGDDVLCLYSSVSSLVVSQHVWQHLVRHFVMSLPIDSHRLHIIILVTGQSRRTMQIMTKMIAIDNPVAAPANSSWVSSRPRLFIANSLTVMNTLLAEF